MAITEKIGTTDFFIYSSYKSSTDSSSLYYRPILAHRFTKKITIPTQTLDHFCSVNNIDHIDFLKIDAEGAEWSIFLGAQELLSKQAITLIQFE